MDTIKGQFAIGLWDEKSKAFQRDFEMRLATLEDTENALEDTPEYASTARIRRHEWAACLLSVGCIPGDEITPERLAELASRRVRHSQRRAGSACKKAQRREKRLADIRLTIAALVRHGFSPADVRRMTGPEAVSYLEIFYPNPDKGKKKYISLKRKRKGNGPRSGSRSKADAERRSQQKGRDSA